MKDLKLELLQDGTTTGLTPINGGFLAEAASVCLFANKHSMSVRFIVEGAFEETYNLLRLDVTELLISSYGDLEEAVQFGAMGLAVLIINDKTQWKATRSWKGTGFDYWFGDESVYPFQNKLRAEVSGDLKGTDSEINARLKQKMVQTEKSNNVLIPACAVIIEFGNPKSVTGIK